MGDIFDLRAKSSIYGRNIEYKGDISILRANYRFPDIYRHLLLHLPCPIFKKSHPLE
jgi:hypothetical protein